jgi:hypothetical protein
MKTPCSLLFLCIAFSLAAQERILLPADFKNPVLSAHVNGQPAAPPEGAALRLESDGLRMDYVFASSGHDACMVEFAVHQDAFTQLTVEMTVSADGPRPFVVLSDVSGEKHYFSLIDTRNIANQALKKAGRQVFSIPISVQNQHPGEKFAFRWGGDDNQRIDFPVKSIMLGLNDYPDDVHGSGSCIFHKISFQ